MSDRERLSLTAGACAMLLLFLFGLQWEASPDSWIRVPGCFLFFVVPLSLLLVVALVSIRPSARPREDITQDLGQPPEEREVPGPPFPARIRSGIRTEAHGKFRYTEFSCEMPDAHRRLLVVTREWAGRAMPHPGMAPLDVGSWPYAVYTNDAAFAADLLDPATRIAIERLDVLDEGPLLVDLRPGVLILRAEGAFFENLVLKEFIARSYAVARRMLPGRVEIGPIQREVAGAASCRVCGCTFKDRAVLCAKCSTPHHAECWEYNGGCSVYACGGREAAG